MKTNKEIFENIYKNGTWNNNNKKIPLSGSGSSLKNSKECSKVLNKFIYDNSCKSIIDLGCGDLTWISKTDFFNDKNIKYIGVDVVEFLINKHKNKYKQNIFKCKDIVYFNNFEFTSLIIIRDVIFHLENNEVLQIFDNLKNKFKYILITSNKNKINKKLNKCHYAHKNLFKKPFNKLQNYEIIINEQNRNVLIYEHNKFYESVNIFNNT